MDNFFQQLEAEREIARVKAREYRRKWRLKKGIKPREYIPKPEKEFVLPDYKARYRQSKYGLTPEQYNAMFAAQNYSCAVCKSPEPSCVVGWVIDHCHKTKKVRGILCSACNRTIGHAKEDPERLRAAADYLER